MKTNIAWCFLLCIMLCPLVFHSQNDSIATVTGTISTNDLSLSLTHEHIMSNYGVSIDSTAFYDEKALFEQVVTYLKGLRQQGVRSVFDCTTAYFGRRVDLLEEISKRTDIHIITNTGFYGSANDRYIPQLAYEQPVEEIAQIWINEFDEGIDGTKIKPGFIKLAFDSGSPSTIDLKLVEAGILTHLETGLTMAIHTGENRDAAQKTLSLLNKHQVSPSAWVWVHANKQEDNEMLFEMARLGTWISLDGVNPSNYKDYVDRLQKFKNGGLLKKVLLSHDGNGFPAGGAIRSFDAITQFLIPELKTNGFTENEIEQLTVENPKKAFTPVIRRSE